MPKMIFVNLPVKDLQRATDFYTQLGYEKNDQFSDENASCIVISDTIFVMLLVEDFFTTFTHRPISDAKSQTGVILALSADSREDVDHLIGQVVATGGEKGEPSDQGFMYSQSFRDPDGHMWETLYMDPTAIQQ